MFPLLPVSLWHCLAPLTLKQEVVGSRLTLFTIFIVNSVEFYSISLGTTRMIFIQKSTQILFKNIILQYIPEAVPKYHRL